jgi:pyruvate/2-oxoglutarate dehydrogenase complex dihydrolipoamide acyltransferase (E2) component
MKKFYGTIAIALVLGLAACSEESSEVKESAPAAKKEDSASTPEPAPAPTTQTEAPAAESPPAPAQAETPAAAAANQQAEEQAGADADVAPGTPSKDEQVCLQAVSTETNNGDVVTLSVETSEANTVVMVGVGPSRVPWKCLASGGVVAEVSSMTDEGAL